MEKYSVISYDHVGSKIISWQEKGPILNHCPGNGFGDTLPTMHLDPAGTPKYENNVCNRVWENSTEHHGRF